MPRRPILAITGVLVLALPASASAASAELDRACYVAGQPGTVTLAGFTPGASIAVSSPELGTTDVTADAAGGSVVDVVPPDGAELDRPTSREFTVTATETATGVVATTRSRFAPRAFSTDTGTKAAKSPRRWVFSGWTPGRPIYAHFRLGGRTRGTHRFGLATGPCGIFQGRAPGIAIPGTVAPGVWTIQVDQARAYSASRRPSVREQTVVYRTYRSR